MTDSQRYPLNLCHNIKNSSVFYLKLDFFKLGFSIKVTPRIICIAKKTIDKLSDDIKLSRND